MIDENIWKILTYDEYVNRISIPPDTYENLKKTYKTQDKINEILNIAYKDLYEKYKKSCEESFNKELELWKKWKKSND